ncbi:MAG: hypothetical protein V1744_02160 [Candidatus Altiarchaeota archaeon]
MLRVVWSNALHKRVPYRMLTALKFVLSLWIMHVVVSRVSALWSLREVISLRVVSQSRNGFVALPYYVHNLEKTARVILSPVRRIGQPARMSSLGQKNHIVHIVALMWIGMGFRTTVVKLHLIARVAAPRVTPLGLKFTTPPDLMTL